MDIRVKSLKDLTPEEYRACFYLNLRGSGMMMYSLMDHKNSADAKAIMIWGDAGKKYLMGWALMVPILDEIGWYPTRYQIKKCKYVNQFYVRKPERSKGLGTILMNEVKKIEPVPLVIPHDPASGDFFASHKVVSSRDRRDVISEAKRRKKRRAA